MMDLFCCSVERFAEICVSMHLQCTCLFARMFFLHFVGLADGDSTSGKNKQQNRDDILFSHIPVIKECAEIKQILP